MDITVKARQTAEQRRPYETGADRCRVRNPEAPIPCAAESTRFREERVDRSTVRGVNLSALALADRFRHEAHEAQMSEPGHEGRSRAVRVEGEVPVVLLHGGRETPCAAVNLSRSGMLLTGPLAWPEGDDFRVIMSTPAGDLHAAAMVHKVRTAPARADVRSTMAVEFVGLTPVEREGLEFLIQRLFEGRSSAPRLPEIPPGTPPHEIRKALETVSLMHRIGLASRAGPRERETLLHDHSPQVLDALARNPMLLLSEARTIAACPNVVPGTLTILASDSRWGEDEEIRVAIVANPRVQVPVAERLIGRMNPAARRRALQKPGIQAEIRTILVRLLPRA